MSREPITRAHVSWGDSAHHLKYLTLAFVLRSNRGHLVPHVLEIVAIFTYIGTYWNAC